MEAQLQHVVSSGLYDRLDKLFCGVLIKESEKQKIDKFKEKYDKMEFMYFSEDGSLFEFQTLSEMQKKTNELPNFVGFYFHTKGISWIHTNSRVYNVCMTWREMNEYFLFDRYRLAIHAINGLDYDVYGTNYTKIYNDKYRNIGLNFFWFSSRYVNKLKELDVSNRSFRFLSEAWICSETHNVYCPFRFTGNDRNVAVPKELYQTVPFYKRFMISSVMYFSRYKWYIYNFLGIRYTIKNPVAEEEMRRVQK